MHVSNIANLDELNSLVVQQLTNFGISIPRSRPRPKTVIKKNGPSHTGGKQSRPVQPKYIFKLPMKGLDSLPTENVTLKCGASVKVANFIADACDNVLRNVDTEGIFRRPGSASRQDEIMYHIDLGKKLKKDSNEADVACVLKRFFRDLPEPLLPSANQEVFLRSMLLKDKKIEGILYSCLLLPLNQINTLAYLMGILSVVASHSKANKMTANNLAVIWAPTIMPIDEELMTVYSQNRNALHIEIVELLIANADKIGMIPELLANSVSAANLILHMSAEDLERYDADSSSHSKQKKHRRSGSLTRMINGIKKMVGKGGAELNESGDTMNTSLKAVVTPCIKAPTKRKALQPMSMFSTKKKRDVLRTLPQMLTLASTPVVVPMHHATGDTTPHLYHLTPSVSQHPNPRKSLSPLKLKQRRFFGPNTDKINAIVEEVEKKSRLSLRSRRSLKKQKRSGEVPALDTDAAELLEHPPMMERRWSTSFFGKKKRVSDINMFRPTAEVVADNVEEMQATVEMMLSDPFTVEADVNVSLVGVNLSLQADPADLSEDFIRIPKREFEDFKNRVSAMELKIEEFDSMVSPSMHVNASPLEGAGSSTDLVQSKYQRTLVQSTTFDHSSTDQLAKRFSRELKIRRSLENRVIRSPSARRIGSLRRRSRDSARSAGKKSNGIRNATLTRNLSWHLSTNPDPAHVAASQFYPRPSLRRGRPNTVFMGLPQPSATQPASISLEENLRIHLVFDHEHSKTFKSGHTLASNVSSSDGGSVQNRSSQCTPTQIPHYLSGESLDNSGPITRSQSQRSSSFNGTEKLLNEVSARDISDDVRKSNSHGHITSPVTASKEEWVDAQSFFNSKQDHLSKLPSTGRDSIAKIRTQNAGMVLQRMRLFDASKASPLSSVHRRSYEKSKIATPKRLGRTQSVLAVDSASKQRTRQFVGDSVRSIPRIHYEQFDQIEKAERFGVQKSSCTPTLKGSPKKIGSPRKYQLSKNSVAVQQIQKLKINQPKTKGGAVISPAELTKLKGSPSGRSFGPSVPTVTTIGSVLPAKWLKDSKENITTPVGKSRLDQSKRRPSDLSFSPQINLPDNLKETIYDVCTPVADKLIVAAKVTSASPLKDCNRLLPKTPRDTPFIKQPLLPMTPRHATKTPQKMSVDRNGRRLLTPMRALGSDACNTPIGSPRRQSPRLLLMKQRALATLT